LSAPLDDPLGLGADPIAAFRRWFAHASAAGLAMPEAMTLATAAPDGAPSLRWVLFKTVDDAGAFSFFTSYESRKAGELTANPHAALAFWWPALERQVRVEGTVGRVPAAASDAYWASRHPDSRLAAATSPQSAPAPDRAAMERAFEETVRRFAGGGTSVPRPETWGGFAVTARAIEFWQGRAHRFHDRFRFTRDAAGAPWTMTRLWP
jgi:pyridoxamine 5'-phosphate oxidase